MVSNKYLYKWFESDFISITKANYLTEYEIKITISDFKRDFTHKPIKHTWLNGKRVGELFLENDIIVGMYQIRLFFNHREVGQHRTRLRDYGGFRIAIYERTRKGTVLHNINLNKDSRFKHETWIDLNKDCNVRIKNLVDIIILLQRLNSLRMFL